MTAIPAAAAPPRAACSAGMRRAAAAPPRGIAAADAPAEKATRPASGESVDKLPLLHGLDCDDGVAGTEASLPPPPTMLHHGMLSAEDFRGDDWRGDVKFC